MDNDGVYRLSDGGEWSTLLTIKDGWVQEVRGMWQRDLEGQTLKQVEELAVQQKLQLKKEWAGWARFRARSSGSENLVEVKLGEWQEKAGQRYG